MNRNKQAVQANGRRLGWRSSLRLKMSSMQKLGEITIDIGKGNFNESGSNRTTLQPYKTPRTVELLPSQSLVGEERHKLPFMMALGLIPRADQVHRHGPVVCIERLDPAVVAKVDARLQKMTKKAVGSTKTDNTASEISHSENSSSSAFSPVANQDIELIDLVSSWEDEGVSDDEKIAVNPCTISGTFNVTSVQRKRKSSEDSWIYDENDSGYYEESCTPPRRRCKNRYM